MFSFFVLIKDRLFRAFQVGLSASRYLVENGDIWFIAELGTGANSTGNAMAMSNWVSFCFLPGIHYWFQV